MTMAAAVTLVPQAASAQLFLNDPNFQRGPIDPSDPLVGLPIPGATPAEYRAHLLWNMRAGLNVAALQCQFSPYLRTVDNYNGILAHHSKELADAYTTMNNYFKRVNGAKAGQKAFDDYTTITYNNFSTLQAQYGFCQTAAAIAKEALSQPKGELFTLAQQRMRELRNSLTPAYDSIGTYNPQTIRQPVFPSLDPKCWDKKNRLKKQCATQPFG
ncbi:MAG TPA: hypothetical protein VGD10_12765 [Allosphingosinicella sp.]|uniref:hypothetical protein n=1 Tax=Allosphingosinicella sp. TaxID=2823234 RepID=UPI002EDB6234